jgi:hypothetical protein
LYHGKYIDLNGFCAVGAEFNILMPVASRTRNDKLLTQHVLTKQPVCTRNRFLPNRRKHNGDASPKNYIFAYKKQRYNNTFPP